MGKQARLLISGSSLLALLLSITPLSLVTIGHGNLSSVVFGAALTLLLVGSLLGSVAWLLGLMRAARIQQWDWFIAVLLLGPLGTLLHGIASAGE